MRQTHTSEIKISGKSGIIVLIAVIALVIFRLISFNDVKDPAILKLFEQELVSEWRREHIPKFSEAVKAGSLKQSGLDAEDLLKPNLVIPKIRASQPVLSFSSNQRVIYEVTFSIKGSGGNELKETRYYEVEHSLIGQPRLKRRSNQYRFFMNFY